MYLNHIRLKKYRPDLPLYTVPSTQSSVKKKMRAKLTASLLSDPPPPKQSDVVSAGKRKKADKSQDLPPSQKKQAHIDVVSTVFSGKKRKAKDNENSPPVKKGAHVAVLTHYRADTGTIQCQQRWACQQLELQFVCDNGTTLGGPDVILNPVCRVSGDGKCLFRALFYIITWSDDEHLLLRTRIIEYMQSTDLYMQTILIINL